MCPLDVSRWRSCCRTRSLVTDAALAFPIVGPGILPACHRANQRSMVRSVRDFCRKKEIQTRLTRELEGFPLSCGACRRCLLFCVYKPEAAVKQGPRGGLLRTSLRWEEPPSPPSTTENREEPTTNSKQQGEVKMAQLHSAYAGSWETVMTLRGDTLSDTESAERGNCVFTKGWRVIYVTKPIKSPSRKCLFFFFHLQNLQN